MRKVSACSKFFSGVVRKRTPCWRKVWGKFGARAIRLSSAISDRHHIVFLAGHNVDLTFIHLLASSSRELISLVYWTFYCNVRGFGASVASRRFVFGPDTLFTSRLYWSALRLSPLSTALSSSRYILFELNFHGSRSMLALSLRSPAISWWFQLSGSSTNSTNALSIIEQPDIPQLCSSGYPQLS